jgi:hypothetical protein
MPRYVPALLAIAAGVPWAAFGDTVRDLYVSAGRGSDSAPGSVSQPFKSIAQAVRMAMRNYANSTGTRMHIGPGVYREAITLMGMSVAGGPQIAFEGSGIGQTIVSGSDEWGRWQQAGPNPQVYAHAWPYHWGESEPIPGWPPLADIVKRREMIFLNGALMKQVLSQAELQPGTFSVDESSGIVDIWVPTGTDMNVAKVEVSTRPLLFNSSLVSNLTISGISFQNSNACMAPTQSAAVIIANAANVIIERVAVNWNNWHGLALYSITNAILRGVHADHNGELGMSGYRLKDATLENVTTSGNNWRGQWGGFDTWEPGGAKFLRTHGGVFTGYVATNNIGRGVWFDTDNADVSVVRGVFANNSRDGLFIEKNQGPVTIADSRICNNGDAGVLTNSEQVTLDGDKVYENRATQVQVESRGGPARIKNWETSEEYQISPAHLSLMNGTYARTTQGALFSMNARSADEISKFLGTLHAYSNSWYGPQGSDAFQLHVAGKTEVTDLTGWKRLTNQDQDSVFSPSVHAAQGSCTGEQ